VLAPWEAQPAYLPPNRPQTLKRPKKGPWPEPITHPVGIVMSMEGLEGLRAPEELEEWWEHGRAPGREWYGPARACAAAHMSRAALPAKAWPVMEVMAELGFTLDLSHMTEESALQALDRYPGAIIASHANARALLRGIEGERHLTDRTIRRLIERDGIMGVIPYNRFLKTSWSSGQPPRFGHAGHTGCAYRPYLPDCRRCAACWPGQRL
jgi:membrane dipeptidase